jgi:hypothetical protein
MLDLWRDTTESDTGVPRSGIVMPASIAYRATSPVYAGEGYRVILDKQASSDGTTLVAVVSNDGTVCMKGTIKNF